MLDGMFNARRVAVVGVSPNPGNAGQGIIANMQALGFQGQILAVGRSGGELNGNPIYRSVEGIPGEIDLGVFLVPARLVAENLDACGLKGAKWGVILASGFGEYEAEREELEQELLAIARKHGMRFVGPNCLGIVNFATGLATPFAPVGAELVHRGPVSIISQSGAVAQTLTQLLSSLGPGVNKFISVGNKLDLDEVDYLDYLAGDPSAEVICMYLEDIRRGRDLMDAARRCRKPVLIHKAGATAAGAKIAKSHTAALAVNDTIADAAMRQAGIVRIDGLRKMAIASGVVRLPKLKGNRIVVISPSGGSAVLVADLCDRHGFTLPLPDREILQSIEQGGRAGVIHLTNPLDLGDIWNPDFFVDAVRQVASLSCFDGAIVIFPIGHPVSGMFGGPSEAMVSGIKQIGLEAGKPLLLSSMGGTRGITEISHKLDFPIVVDPEDTVEALIALGRYSKMH